MSQIILIGSANGKTYIYDTSTHKLEPYDKPYKTGVMGLAKSDGHLFIASREMIVRHTKGCPPISQKFSINSPQFHQLMVHQKKIYITCTSINEIWIFDYNLKLLAKKCIAPPNPNVPVSWKRNYNHVNSICYHNDLFYVGLNWFTSKQYGKSGVGVFNNDFEEQRRFEYGWETHGFTFVDDQPYALCATSSPIGKSINHPKRAGLMVDGKLVFEHPIDIFCKAFVITTDRIYLLGGNVAVRHQRGNVEGIIYALDRDFNLLTTHQFDGTGQFCGGMLL